MRLPERITVDPDIMMGKPCVRGTRIPVYLLLQKMEAGETPEALLVAYPQLSRADLQAVWEYAARSAAEEVVLAQDSVRFLFGENLSVAVAIWAETKTDPFQMLSSPEKTGRRTTERWFCTTSRYELHE